MKLSISMKYAVAMAKKEGFELDLFSTFLSRKYSYHKQIGKLRLTKVKKEVNSGRV